jgi:hypothetical protein
MYVSNDKTLPAQLNRLLERERIGNLAVDGLHSVAMYGLVKHYASAITNTKAILHFNPLWLNSKRQDLTDEKEFGIHHPRLLPQWFPRIKSYSQDLEAKVRIAGEKYLPHVSLTNHLRLCQFDNKSFGQWVIDNPDRNPFAQLSLRIDAASKQNASRVEDRQQQDLGVRDWRWVTLTESLQWKYFVKTVRLLQKRGNEVFVMLGSINPHMMTPESLRRYRTLQSELAGWLDQHNPDYFTVPDMPSSFYTDASHPTERGYGAIAEQMLDNNKFRHWISK